MDPNKIKNEILSDAKKKKATKDLTCEKARKNSELKRQKKIDNFASIKKVAELVCDDLELDADLKISDERVRLYKRDGFGGGSDTFTYSYDLKEGKLVCNHKEKFGVYIDDFGASSYDFNDPSRNEKNTKIVFDNEDELIEHFKKTITKFVKV